MKFQGCIDFASPPAETRETAIHPGSGMLTASVKNEQTDSGLRFLRSRSSSEMLIDSRLICSCLPYSMSGISLGIK